MPRAPQRLSRIEPPNIPPEFGTTPIPEGTVRFNHFTWGAERAQSIREQGILRSHSEEAYARGGTESPQVFATAGHPGEMPNRGERHFIEGYARPEQLDIGAPYAASHLSEEQLGEHMRGLEQRKSVITFHGDVPKEQILAVHEPWHQTYHYLNRDPSMEANVMAGEYDDIEPELDEAMKPIKVGLAAKVMLGGKLEGEAWK
jgi:hypothetical protein